MFERLLREIQEVNGTKISIPISEDKDGYLDKECPSKECLFQFKIYGDDWDKKIRNDTVLCPLCKHEEKADRWFTAQQINEATEQATKYILSKIDKALVEGANDFNSQHSRNPFIKMSMSVSGTKPYHYILPISAEEEMTLKILCKKCGCRYAVIGSAFFCPCCGHNCADETFDGSIRKIEAKLKNIEVIRKAVEQISLDEAEITCRSLIETSLHEAVVAFQRFCEVRFAHKQPLVKIKFNAFQSLEKGSDYWRNLYGEDYKTWLTTKEYSSLIILFQRRHLLSHTEGIVDQRYIDNSGDDTYKIGQRITVKTDDIENLLLIITKIISVIRSK